MRFTEGPSQRGLHRGTREGPSQRDQRGRERGFQGGTGGQEGGASLFQLSFMISTLFIQEVGTAAQGTQQEVLTGMRGFHSHNLRCRGSGPWGRYRTSRTPGRMWAPAGDPDQPERGPASLSQVCTGGGDSRGHLSWLPMARGEGRQAGGGWRPLLTWEGAWARARGGSVGQAAWRECGPGRGGSVGQGAWRERGPGCVEGGVGRSAVRVEGLGGKRSDLGCPLP